MIDNTKYFDTNDLPLQVLERFKISGSKIIDTHKKSIYKHAEDPILIGQVVDDIIDGHEWSKELSIVSINSQWEDIVGNNLATHCAVESFFDGTLVIKADSTAWSTQLRLFIPQLLTQISKNVGPDVVFDIKVHGPSKISWTHGRLAVPGRGPRDTYG